MGDGKVVTRVTAEEKYGGGGKSTTVEVKELGNGQLIASFTGNQSCGVLSNEGTVVVYVTDGTLVVHIESEEYQDGEKKRVDRSLIIREDDIAFGEGTERFAGPYSRIKNWKDPTKRTYEPASTPAEEQVSV